MPEKLRGRRPLSAIRLIEMIDTLKRRRQFPRKSEFTQTYDDSVVTASVCVLSFFIEPAHYINISNNLK